MTKLSIGIGEDFPVEERGRDDACAHGQDRRHHHHPHHDHHHFWHEFWHRHFARRREDAPTRGSRDAIKDQDKKE
jgi:hypothetical protein